MWKEHLPGREAVLLGASFPCFAHRLTAATATHPIKLHLYLPSLPEMVVPAAVVRIAIDIEMELSAPHRLRACEGEPSRNRHQCMLRRALRSPSKLLL